ncbi:Sugar/inositol transporter [Heracleum sosnowskyi]|uniref:Sugar/inositol transporter n=1 Tax=Heracleum sosnowskyi TaxID=360622 RepID=A0AAD8GQF4_9APIA|nr:Sugar/inositol transporter [Heracleum sosnowskyi]
MANKQNMKVAERNDQVEIRVPLILGQKAKFADEDDYAVEYQTGKDKGREWILYLTTFVTVCGSFAFGSCIGFSSPIQSAITEDLNLTLAEYSLFGSILNFGAMIGAITSGRIADFTGRKGAMRVASSFCTAGWLAIYFAEGPLPLNIGRLATGYGMGVYSYVIPVFIAEISPKHLRGALTTTSQLMIICGISFAFIVGTVITWRTLALTGIIPCAVLLLGLLIVPESPRWLAKNGDHEKFLIALQRLRGKEADISEEATEIQDYIRNLEKLPKSKLMDLFQRRYLRSIIIGVGLMFAQQLGGINGVCFYVRDIFESAGFPSDTGTIIYACLQVAVTALGALVIDRAGRKPLLLVSASGLIVGCILTGLSFYLKTYEIALNAIPALAVSGILVYIGSFSIGMGAVPWVIMSEIFPLDIKGSAGSLATLANWSTSWAVSYTFNFLISWSSYGTYIIYGTINAISILFILMVVPETKGRTLEEIQAAINA